MLTVRFIRHGESLANAGGVTAEPEAIPLTARGYEQAEAISRSFGRPPTLIVTSPYLRALETAKRTSERFPETPLEIWPVQEIEPLSRARRMNTSASERLPMIESYWANADPHFVDGPGAESYAAFVERVRATLNRLAEVSRALDAPGQFAIFSHGQFMKGLQWETAENSPPITPETMRAFFAFHRAAPIANAESFSIRWDHGRLRFLG